MLQAMIDESDSQQAEPRLFVMGGYIASVRQWERLTDEWQAELNRAPRLRNFSFHKAFPGSGRPHGQSEEERNVRVSNLREIIQRNVTAEIGIGFQVADHYAAYEWDKKLRNNPYGYAFVKLLASMSALMETLRLGKQRVDFIFDKRVIDEPKLLDGWFYAREHARPADPDIFKKILVNTPVFRSDAEVIALQAADMFAGSMRAANIAIMNSREPHPLWGLLLPDGRRAFIAPNAKQIRADAEAERARSMRGGS